MPFDVGQLGRIEAEVGDAVVTVGDVGGAADGAVALPDLVAVGEVVGGEVEGLADGGEVLGVDAAVLVVASW